MTITRPSVRSCSPRQLLLSRKTPCRLASNQPLFGRHAHGSVQADHLTIQHFVFNNVLDQSRKFLRTSQARRKRHLLSEQLPSEFWKSCQERCIENRERCS